MWAGDFHSTAKPETLWASNLETQKNEWEETVDEENPAETPISELVDGGGDQVERRIGFLLDDVHRLMSRAFDRRMVHLGLTRTQWRVVTFLLRHNGLTQTQLAELLEMEKAPLGRLLDRLEDKDWIVRRNDPTDRRAKRVYHTQKIDPILPALKDDADKVLQIAFGNMDLKLRTALADELAQVKSNLQRAEAEANATSESAMLPDRGV